MRSYYCLLFSLLAACQTNTSNKSTPIGAIDTPINAHPTAVPLKVPSVYDDSTYTRGDYLFVGDKNVVIDFFPTDTPPRRLISKGDTLYMDNAYTILVDNRKSFGPVYKKYIPKYRFEDYKTSDLFPSPFATPNFLTDPPSRHYRTMIGEACADSVPNFAGHCTIAEWGCGTACGMMALVDRTNGRVFYSSKYLPFDSLDGHWGIDFRKDSRLLIVNSYLLYDHPGYMMQDDWRKLSFYEWNGSGFTKLE